MKISYNSIVFFLPLPVTSCYLEVPVEEMSRAKASISRAREVNADKYAPEELNAAEEKLYLSHNQIKENKISAARHLVKVSNTEAEKAIEKSLPFFSGDKIAEAKKAYEKADLVYSEKSAPEDLSGAEKSIGQAEELRITKGYRESYQKSKEAVDLAAGATEK